MVVVELLDCTSAALWVGWDTRFAEHIRVASLDSHDRFRLEHYIQIAAPIADCSADT